MRVRPWRGGRAALQAPAGTAANSQWPHGQQHHLTKRYFGGVRTPFLMFTGIFIGLLKRNSLSDTLANKTRVPSEWERQGCSGLPTPDPCTGWRSHPGQVDSLCPWKWE